MSVNMLSPRTARLKARRGFDSSRRAQLRRRPRAAVNRDGASRSCGDNILCLRGMHLVRYSCNCLHHDVTTAGWLVGDLITAPDTGPGRVLHTRVAVHRMSSSCEHLSTYCSDAHIRTCTTTKGYKFPSSYITFAGVRVHYIDVSDRPRTREQPVALLLHGQSSLFSFLCAVTHSARRTELVVLVPQDDSEVASCRIPRCGAGFHRLRDVRCLLCCLQHAASPESHPPS